jgi:hypothetical protein
LLPGGQTRRRSPRPVPRRRSWRRRARASGAIQVCLGDSWGRGALVRLIGGAFYRPERRGRGRPEARRSGGPRRVRRATLGTAASLACWGALVSAAACCGSTLARAGWSATCRMLGRKEGGSGVLPSLLLPFSRLGSGLGAMGSTEASSRSMATVLERARTVQPTVSSIWFDSCLPVFDEMPARV